MIYIVSKQCTCVINKRGHVYDHNYLTVHLQCTDSYNQTDPHRASSMSLKNKPPFSSLSAGYEQYTAMLAFQGDGDEKLLFTIISLTTKVSFLLLVNAMDPMCPKDDYLYCQPTKTSLN